EGQNHVAGSSMPFPHMAKRLPGYAPVRSASIIPILSTGRQQESARIPDRTRQHGVKLTLGEFPGLLRDRLARRYHPVHGTGACCRRRRKRRPARRHCHDLWVGRWWLVTPLVAQPLQLGAHCIAAIAQPTCDLTGTMAGGPELFEQCYVFRIPTPGRYLYTE